jgi:hypothetical protein
MTTIELRTTLSVRGKRLAVSPICRELKRLSVQSLALTGMPFERPAHDSVSAGTTRRANARRERLPTLDDDLLRRSAPDGHREAAEEREP